MRSKTSWVRRRQYEEWFVESKVGIEVKQSQENERMLQRWVEGCTVVVVVVEVVVQEVEEELEVEDEDDTPSNLDTVKVEEEVEEETATNATASGSAAAAAAEGEEDDAVDVEERLKCQRAAPLTRAGHQDEREPSTRMAE